jgi:hypothetical protein
MDFDRLQFLLQRYFDQMLTVEERAELSTMLLASARARDEFWQEARWNAVIRQWGEAEWGRRDAENFTQRPVAVPVAKRPDSKIIRFPRPAAMVWQAALAVAAVVAFFMTVPALLPWKKSETPSPAVVATAANVAVLTHSADAVWSEEDADRKSGDSLAPGWLKLKAGVVQVEFSRGARVVLEGPAEFELLTDNSAYLQSGKLRAHVPEPAHGFAVRSRGFEVIDHGTEFGIDLPVTGASQIHVFSGLIALHRPDAKPRKMRTNEAVKIDQGRVNEIPARRDQFLSDEELARRERTSAHGKLAAWRKASRLLSEHPAALLHLDFEGDRTWARSIPNRAWRAVPEAPAIMVGSQFAEGRWPGKAAVEFTRPDDRLRLNLPGGYESLTLVAWVRVDNLPDRPQSLIMADGMGTGDVQWYLSRWGELGFGVHIGKPGDASGWRFHHSAAVITPETLGSWVCLALVFDGSTDMVTHYFNGQSIGSERLGVRTLLQLEMFEIGNWALREGQQRSAGVVPRADGDSARNLQGRIDELAIFSAPLTGDEIRRISEVAQVADLSAAKNKPAAAR